MICVSREELIKKKGEIVNLNIDDVNINESYVDSVLDILIDLLINEYDKIY